MKPSDDCRIFNNVYAKDVELADQIRQEVFMHLAKGLEKLENFKTSPALVGNFNREALTCGIGEEAL